MSRRMTLGAVSPGQLNSRASMGPGRVNKDGGLGGAAGKAGRKSLCPAAMPGILSTSMGGGSSLLDGRRSSTFAPKTAGTRVDPRPLGSADFQRRCGEAIVEYLVSKDFPASVSVKTLLNPTGKDFATIVQFLCNRMDPNFPKMTKLEDEVPMFFKRLNYPFQISKSALFAVGSQNSWPAVLAALAWLVELLNYNEKAAQQTPTSFHNGLDRRDAVFYEYASNAYRHFLAGDDAKCDEWDQKMMANFKEQELTILAQREKVRQSRAVVLAEMQALEATPDPLATSRSRLADYRVDEDKYTTLIDQNRAMNVTLERKVQERQADVNAKQSQIMEAGKELEELRQRVAGQTYNKADLNRMLMERSKQQEVLDAVRAQVDEAEQRLHDKEKLVNRKFKELEASVQQYNSVAHRLKLVPAAAKRAEGATFELRLNRGATSQAELVNIDIRGVVRPGLERVLEQYRRKAVELSTDLAGLREAALAGAEQLNERAEESAALEHQINQMEAQLRATKESQEAQLTRANEAAERVRSEVVALRQAASGRAAGVEVRRAAAQQDYENVQRACAAQVQQLRLDLRRAMELLDSHRQHCQRRLHDTVEAVRRVAHEAAALPLPTVPTFPASP